MADEPTTTTARLPLLVSAAFFVVAVAGVAWFATGRFTAPDRADADHLWRPWSLLAGNEALVGLVSLLVLVAGAVALVAAGRQGRLRAPLPALLGVLALFAAWLGMGYRVVTAGVVGANIGGGGIVLLTPFLALGTLVVVIVLLAQRPQRR